MTSQVLKSPNDERLYRICVLQNGLKVLLIQDPQARNSTSGTENLQETKSDCLLNEESSEESSLSLNSGRESVSEEKASDSDGQEVDYRKEKEHKELGQEKAVKKAAAAISVGVGSFSDPWDLQGLSHFLEHMLFMGSEKHPDENDYDAFLTAHGGSSNAMTEAEATTFYFDVNPESLHDALDRFAQFFTSPLIKKDAMEREVEAVNNEFKGVLQSDACRLQQLKCYTAQENHPFRKFSWGNKKSLMDDPMQAGLDARVRLLDHYRVAENVCRSKYSAERMNLVILGSDTLDLMQLWAEQLFGAVPSGHGPPPTFEGAGFPFKGGRLYVLPSVRDEHKLQITFQLPCLNKLYRKKADEYLSHLVGHEGKGSLLSALKVRGWATELCAGVSDQSTITWLFDITIMLTEAGLNHGLGCGLSCAQLLFEYLSMLKQAGPQAWAYNEMSAISNMKFRFQEEEDAADYVTQLATDLHIYPPEHVLIGPYHHDDFDGDLINELLGIMSPSAARLDVQTKAYEQCKGSLLVDANSLVDRHFCRTGVEPWFEIPFVEVQIPDSLLQSWAAAVPSADLALPPQNSYIPSDFSLVHKFSKNPAPPRSFNHQSASDSLADRSSLEAICAEQMAQPLFPEPPNVIVDEPGLRVWHKIDYTFCLPRINSYWKLVSPFAYDTPQHAALAHLLLKLLEDALCETTYLAEVAGLHYNIWNEGRQGIDFKVEGFSQKLPLLCSFIFQTLAKLHVDEDSFQRVQEALLRQYRNVNMKGLKHASYLRLMVLKDTLWPAETIQKEVERAVQDDVRQYLELFLSTLHVECLLQGNITVQQAEALSREVRQILSATAGQHGTLSLLDADARPNDRCVQLPRPCNLLFRVDPVQSSALVEQCRAPVKNSKDDNSVVELYFQLCVDTDADRAIVDLLDQILSEPVYNVLRTQEQLGYTVHSGMRLTHGILGFYFVVMSGAHGPSFLDSRIEAFLDNFGDSLLAMPEAQFEKHRTSLLSIKLMKDRNMAEESDRAWACVASRRYNFKSREDEVAHIRLLKLQQIQDFYGRYIQPNSHLRRKLSIHIVGRAHCEEQNAPAPDGIQLLNNLPAWRQKVTYYPTIAGATATTWNKLNGQTS